MGGVGANEATTWKECWNESRGGKAEPEGRALGERTSDMAKEQCPREEPQKVNRGNVGK